MSDADENDFHLSVMETKKLRVREERKLAQIYFERERLCIRPPLWCFACH